MAKVTGLKVSKGYDIKENKHWISLYLAVDDVAWAVDIASDEYGNVPKEHIYFALKSLASCVNDA